MCAASTSRRYSCLAALLGLAGARGDARLPPPLEKCEIHDAALPPEAPFAAISEVALRGACARGRGGSFWKSPSRFRAHIEGLDRPSAERVLPTLPWSACLSLGCFSLPAAEREERLWRHFLGLAGLAQEPAAELPPPPPVRATVALVVRTYAGALSELLPLLRSAELFWPYERWPVVVVLDAESAGDWWVGSVMIPRWVQVVFEAVPPRFESWVEVLHDGSKGRGWQRAAWSQFHFDHYAEADFVAQIDADAVINTWVDEELLFDDEGRAHITGATQWLNYKHVVRALDLPDDVEFMASQPMVLRRDHFEATRRFITEKMKAADFGEAFSLLTHAVLRNTTTTDGRTASIHHLPCHQSAMGSYLWEFHRSEYAWHVMWRGYGSGSDAVRRWKADYGCPEAKPPELRLRCPQLFVGSHLGAWGNQNIKGFEMARDPVPAQGGQRYLMMSVEVLLAQLCTARQALLDVYGPGVAALADQLVAPPAGGGAARGGAGAAPGGPGPEQLCASALGSTQAASVMLGLSSIAFWRSDTPVEFCAPSKTLMEQWGRHAARSALRHLHSRQLA